jgi:hypothetical protein
MTPGFYTPLHFDQPQLAQVGHFSSGTLLPQMGQFSPLMSWW